MVNDTVASFPSITWDGEALMDEVLVRDGRERAANAGVAKSRKTATVPQNIRFTESAPVVCI